MRFFSFVAVAVAAVMATQTNAIALESEIEVEGGWRAGDNLAKDKEMWETNNPIMSFDAAKNWWALVDEYGVGGPNEPNKADAASYRIDRHQILKISAIPEKARTPGDVKKLNTLKKKHPDIYRRREYFALIWEHQKEDGVTKYMD